MAISYTCQFCGKDTSQVEYDYLSGTDHLSCTLEFEQKNPIEKCIICGADTKYRFHDHIDYRFNYVEGAGQLCDKCGNKEYSDITLTEVDPLGTPNPNRMLILVDETTILYTPNDADLGAKVRKIYWNLKQQKNGK